MLINFFIIYLHYYYGSYLSYKHHHHHDSNKIIIAWVVSRTIQYSVQRVAHSVLYTHILPALPINKTNERKRSPFYKNWSFAYIKIKHFLIKYLVTICMENVPYDWSNMELFYYRVLIGIISFCQYRMLTVSIKNKKNAK